VLFVLLATLVLMSCCCYWPHDFRQVLKHYKVSIIASVGTAMVTC
jgi:hypothetical protein